jgi:hypothetical protein
VTTGINTDRSQLQRMRTLKISVFCSDCAGGHGIPANEMFLLEEERASPLASSVVVV